MTTRELFLRHNAQTSEAPLCFEVNHAEGVYLYDNENKPHLDLIGGISVSAVGHSHPKVLQAIQEQLHKYLHVMVYGEVIQTPQVHYAKALADVLPATLQSVYFTNSGSEATEGAMKLAKRFTRRTKIISFRNSYHGSTQGALSVMGSEYWQQAFRPLLPDVFQFDYGSNDVLAAIDTQTACIILEPVQSEAGVLTPETAWLQAIRQRCSETGCLMILDEIQTAFGRTGSLFRFEQCGIVPDILLLGKALGGGMPMGAFIADKKIMDSLSTQPVLGHITTFGGHPLCCAAGLASLEVLLSNHWMETVKEKEALFHSTLKHPFIKRIQSCGLLMAVEFESFELNKRVIDQCISNGVFTDWFLFAPHCLRLAPPLCISTDEIEMACKFILKSIDEVTHG